MKIFLILMLSFSAINAQDLQISFAGTGATNTVENVEVTNITQGTSLTISGTDILHLVDEVYSFDVVDNHKNLLIFPNPAIDFVNISFEIDKENYTEISIFDLNGKIIVTAQYLLISGFHTFAVNNLSTGIYTVVVKNNDIVITDKIVYHNYSSQNATINYLGDNSNNKNTLTQKKSKNTVQMQYTEGDLLHFKGTSGIYSTVTTLVPTQNQTVTFNFFAATDGNNNNYTTVTIGTQTWLAENLKATKYNNGADIPNITNGTEWANQTTPAYCWYMNNYNTYGSNYGALYNWFVTDLSSTGGKNVCPVGWHVPSAPEWYVLINFIGGDNVAGGKLKTPGTYEAGTGLWYEPNLSATNQYGFSALPAGDRWFEDGAFDYFRCYGSWWTSSNFGTDGGLVRDVSFFEESSLEYFHPKQSGFSIRCVKD